MLYTDTESSSTNSPQGTPEGSSTRLTCINAAFWSAGAGPGLARNDDGAPALAERVPDIPFPRIAGISMDSFGESGCVLRSAGRVVVGRSTRSSVGQFGVQGVEQLVVRGGAQI